MVLLEKIEARSILLKNIWGHTSGKEEIVIHIRVQKKIKCAFYNYICIYDLGK